MEKFINSEGILAQMELIDEEADVSDHITQQRYLKEHNPGNCGICKNIAAKKNPVKVNPKDAIGSKKLPVYLWPPIATALGCLGLFDGMLKYGRNNWRETAISASEYIGALQRHLDALREGEDVDPDSGLDPLSHILATAAIYADAKASGRLIDDRNYRGGYFRKAMSALTSHVGRMREKYADKSPKHFTIQDGRE